MIRHVSHEDIDKAQWDVAVHAAANATWYANSYVLDGMSPGWDALMDDATGAFIPLTKRRKYGIEYLYQPFALQQLGIFAPGPVDAGMTEAFLRAVPSAFRLVQIAGNAAMPRTEVPGWSFTASTNCTLDLSGGMQSVRSGYAKNTVRNLARIGSMRSEAMWPDDFAGFYASTTLARFPDQDLRGASALGPLLSEATSRKEAEILGMRDEQGTWCGAVALIHWQGRSILLKSGATDKGRERKTMFHLVDRALELSSARSQVFDFAGSDHPGTARFYEGFGAEPSAYFRLERNTLPIWAKLFKR